MGMRECVGVGMYIYVSIYIYMFGNIYSIHNILKEQIYITFFNILIFSYVLVLFIYFNWDSFFIYLEYVE